MRAHSVAVLVLGTMYWSLRHPTRTRGAVEAAVRNSTGKPTVPKSAAGFLAPATRSTRITPLSRHSGTMNLSNEVHRSMLWREPGSPTETPDRPKATLFTTTAIALRTSRKVAVRGAERSLRRVFPCRRSISPHAICPTSERKSVRTWEIQSGASGSCTAQRRC